MLRLCVLVVLLQSTAAFFAVGSLVEAVDSFTGTIELHGNFSNIFAAGSFALLGAVLTAADALVHVYVARRGRERGPSAETLTAPLSPDGTPAAPTQWRVSVGAPRRQVASESTSDWRHMYTGE